MKFFKAMFVHVLSISFILSGCVTTGGGGSGGGTGFDVGPQLSSFFETKREAKIDASKPKLDVIIPVFDPGIPEDAEQAKDANIWPELRRAEANRFAQKLKEAMDASGAFGAVRVTPDVTATGDLYVIGKIKESNGEDVEIEVKVVDVAGREWFTRYFEHEVSSEFHLDLRNKGKDPYDPVFKDASNRIAVELESYEDKDLETLKGITNLRFGANMNEQAFAQHLKIEDGQVSLISYPSDDDPMLRRTQAIRVRDQLFVDGLQDTYRSFSEKMDASYLVWQEQSLQEIEAEAEASRKATGEAIIGILAIGLAVAAIAAGARSDNYGSSAGATTAGVLAGAAGAHMLGKSFQTSDETKVHRDALKELGESINVSIAPQVIAIEKQTVELTGTAQEQFAQWRAFLKQIYLEEKTPEKTL